MNPLKYIFNLLAFAFRANRMLYASIAVSLFSAVIELLAMSSLLPLFQAVSGNGAQTGGLVSRAITLLGFQVSAGPLLWAFIILFAVRIVTQLLGQSLSIYLSKRVLAQLGSRAFEQIVRNLSIREISERSMGFYISLAGDEAFRASVLVISLTQFVSTAALAAFYYLAIWIYSPTTGGLVIFFLFVSSLPFVWAMKVTHRLGSRQTEESRGAHSIFLDALNNLKAVRAFSAETYVVKLYRDTIFRYAKTLFLGEVIALQLKLMPVLLLLVVFGGWLLWSGQQLQNIGLAFIVTMIVYLMRFFPVVGQGVVLMMRIASDAKSGKDVTEIVRAKVYDQSTLQRGLGAIEAIDLKGVGFAYVEGRNDVLKDINVRFRKGRSYAVVGKSGAGKSTLLDIVLKFYLPSVGEVYLNEIPLAEIADAEIRKKVILVTQEPAIFDDTVVNNICVGKSADLSEVQWASAMACIHEVISALPEGYDARLMYRGGNLSGGQRQRIAIARALLRRPDVLILDEGTSALDKETQAAVIKNILREYADRIVIFISHDPLVTQLVDEVIDLEKENASAIVRNPYITASE